MHKKPEYNVVNAWLSLINRCLESFLMLFLFLFRLNCTGLQTMVNLRCLRPVDLFQRFKLLNLY
jgi:hypothetical protein